jgi:hypothetical protein
MIYTGDLPEYRVKSSKVFKATEDYRERPAQEQEAQ